MRCTACGAETTAHLCDPCRARLEWALAEVDATLEDVTVTLTRQTRIGAGGVRGSGETPMAYHLGASEAMTSVRLLLKDWVSWVLERHADEGRHTKPPTPASAERLASFLLAHLGWIVRQDTAGDFAREVEAAIKECRRVVDLAPDLITLGVCGGDNGQCDAPLRAVKGHAQTTCKVCGNTWDVQERVEWLLGAAPDTHVTITEATRALSIDRHKVGKWVSRGLLEPVGHRGRKGQPGNGPVYRLGDIHRLHLLAKHGQRLSNITKEPA